MFRHSTFNRFIGLFLSSRPQKIKHCANTIIDTMPYYFASAQYRFNIDATQKATRYSQASNRWLCASNSHNGISEQSFTIIPLSDRYLYTACAFSNFTSKKFVSEG